MFLNAISKYETGRATRLTVTKVVFEYNSCALINDWVKGLTVTKVVFEYLDNLKRNFDLGLTVTKVVFE